MSPSPTPSVLHPLATELLSVPTALLLKGAGLRWRPAVGDRFVLPDRDMDDDVFVLSDMVADVHEFPTGRVIGFNGTVEWALDSVEAETALWLPAEEQLRRLLGGTLVALRRAADDDWRVTVQLPGDREERELRAASAAEAYGRALLELLHRATT